MPRGGGAARGHQLATLSRLAHEKFTDAAAHPEIPGQMAKGEFRTLRGWLRDNLYQHGAKFTATELLRRATGGDLSIEPYLDYL